MIKIVISFIIIISLGLGFLFFDKYTFKNKIENDGIDMVEDYTKIGYIPSDEPDVTIKTFFTKKFTVDEVLFYQEAFNKYKDIKNCVALNTEGFEFQRNWILKGTTFDNLKELEKLLGKKKKKKKISKKKTSKKKKNTKKKTSKKKNNKKKNSE